MHESRASRDRTPGTRLRPASLSPRCEQLVHAPSGFYSTAWCECVQLWMISSVTVFAPNSSNCDSPRGLESIALRKCGKEHKIQAKWLGAAQGGGGGGEVGVSG